VRMKLQSHSSRSIQSASSMCLCRQGPASRKHGCALEAVPLLVRKARNCSRLRKSSRGCWANVCRETLIYSASISVCEKGEQWKQALGFSKACTVDQLGSTLDSACKVFSCRSKRKHIVLRRGVQRNIITYNATIIRACEKGCQWQQALDLFEIMRSARVQRNTITYNAAISACVRGRQWQHALHVLEVHGWRRCAAEHYYFQCCHQCM
jgi:pentatricopeptide repeat protein